MDRKTNPRVTSMRVWLMITMMFICVLLVISQITLISIRTYLPLRLEAISSKHRNSNRGRKSADADTFEFHGDIPRLVHQSFPHARFISEDGIWSQYVSTWVNQNPKYKRLAWSDEEILLFLENNNPKLLRTYTALPLPILKADMSRYIIVNTVGGVYSDMDTSCLKPISRWTSGRDKVSMIIGLEVDACDTSTGQCVSRSEVVRIKMCQS